MKRLLSVCCSMMLLVGAVTGCGSSQADQKEVSLTDFYQSLEEKYDWNNYMVDIDAEMRDSYYPGLNEIEMTQLVAKTPMMSSVVNELVFLECKDEGDTEKAAEILRQRVTDQANGGAWYPESMEAWENADVIQEGNYVAMIACADIQDEVENAFRDLFA